MLRSIKTVLAVTMILAATPFLTAQGDCAAPTVTPRNQQIRIVHEGALWVRIEYGTTDWFCKGSNCSDKGTVTYHVVQIDLRGKSNPFYFTAAVGPKTVSKVAEAEVLGFRCR
jgi:hypothetical protein